jgi:peptide/nickel transport system substrate-binding protein
MRKRIVKAIGILLCAAVAAGLLGGCSLFKLPGEGDSASPTPTPVPSSFLPGGATGGDTIFSINYSSLYGLNPINGLKKVNELAASVVYEGLFAYDENFDYYPVLCESYYTEDGTYYTIKIKSGITFHDGSPLTAYDVHYSINQARRSSLYSGRFSEIYGVSAIDSETIAISLTKANMLFPLLLDVPIIKEGTGDEKNPPGTGPYMLEREQETSFLKAYEGWHGYDKLPLKRIYLQEFDAETIVGAYEEGYVDLVISDPNDPTAPAFSGNSESRYYSTTYLQYIGFNMKRGFFSSSNMRRALSYLIDRTYIVETIMSGGGEEAFVPTAKKTPAVESVASQFSHSPEIVKEMLGAAAVSDYDNDGWVEYMSGNVPVKFTVKFIVNKDNPVKLAAAENIAKAMRELQINVELHKLSWEDYVSALERGDFDMYYAEVKLTADFDLSKLLFRNGELNYGGINDSAYEILINAYLSADESLRETAAEALYNDIASTAPIVPIAFRRQAMLTKRGVVTGARPSASGVFNDIAAWTVDLG